MGQEPLNPSGPRMTKESSTVAQRVIEELPTVDPEMDLNVISPVDVVSPAQPTQMVLMGCREEAQVLYSSTRAFEQFHPVQVIVVGVEEVTQVFSSLAKASG